MSGYLFPSCLDTAWAPDDLATHRPELYEVACAAVGSDPFLRACEDVRFSQPALVALSLSRWSGARNGSTVNTFVGHSAGEITALAVADAVSETEAIWLAAVQGRLMSERAAQIPLAAVALCDTTVKAARHLAMSHDLTVATDNAPHELVLIGRRTLVEAASQTARRLGIRAFQVPSHRAIPSPELASARREWRAALRAAEIRPPKFPVFSCTTVSLVRDPRSVLAEGLTAPVRLRQTITALARVGVRQFAEIDGKAAIGSTLGHRGPTGHPAGEQLAT